MVETTLQVFEGPELPFIRQLKKIDPASDLREGEAMVQVDLATICGSDLHTIEGRRPEVTPCVLGHEAVGTVVAQRGRADISEGDRVTWTIAASCGKCAPCLHYGLPQKCENLFKYGHAPLTDGSGLNGCYASHLVLRAGTHIVRLPDTVTDTIAAPANCALATMVHAVDLWQRHLASGRGVAMDPEWKPGTVVLQGGGLLGIYGCALLREQGVPSVFCVEVDKNRFPLIEQFGGQPVDGEDPRLAAEEILSRCPGGVDAVFEVAGSKDLISMGAQVLRVGGYYGWVGLVHPDSAIDLTAELVIRKCLTLRGVHNYRPADLDDAVAFLHRHADQFPFASLVSPPVPLDQLADAIELARQRRFMRVSVAP